MRAALICLLALSVTPAFAAVQDEAEVGAPLSVEEVPNLALYPLLAKEVEPDPGYLTLDEAVAQKRLKIQETDDSGRVNTLHVTYTGERPVYALAGEVLLGGKQDRIVARHTLIPPGAKGMEIAVFCVEHGRWSGQAGGGRFQSSGALAHTRLRQQANKESQALVWQEVAATNHKRGTDNGTDTYRAALADGDRAARLESAALALLTLTRGQDRLAGVVVAINGQMRAVDWFSAPALYRKLEPKLLRSYLAEAMDAADGFPHPAAPAADATRFLAEADAAALRKDQASGEGAVQYYEGAQVEGTSIQDKQKPGKKAVHRSYFSKTAQDLSAPPSAPVDRRQQRNEPLVY